MNSSNSYVEISIGFAAGAVIAFIDNVAFQGEVSPFFIVVLLAAVTAAAGFVWGRRGWLPAVAAWVCVPAVHLVKHVLGWPDTIQPNTYPSILMLGLFTLVVSAIGLAVGLFVHRLIKAEHKSNL